MLLGAFGVGGCGGGDAEAGAENVVDACAAGVVPGADDVGADPEVEGVGDDVEQSEGDELDGRHLAEDDAEGDQDGHGGIDAVDGRGEGEGEGGRAEVGVARDEQRLVREHGL